MRRLLGWDKSGKSDQPGSWSQYGLIAIVGLILVLSHIWIRLRVVSVGYALADTRQLVHALEEEQRTLTVEWEAVTAPSNLSQFADSRLGLRLPRPEQIIVLP